jgi:hypothetical protein
LTKGRPAATSARKVFTPTSDGTNTATLEAKDNRKQRRKTSLPNGYFTAAVTVTD